MKPSHWTSGHLELLGCSFSKPSREPKAAAPVFVGNLGSGHLRYAFGIEKWCLLYREIALNEMLSNDELYFQRSASPFPCPNLASLAQLTVG